MITSAQIVRRADDEGMPAKTVERDYVLAHVVAAVAGLKVADKLVFKGGTALRLCHFDPFRYSADLDFSIDGGSRDEGLQMIRAALPNVKGTISQLRLTDDTSPRIAYVGPLARERTIKLDIADDEIVIHTERRPFFSRWPDLPGQARVRIYTTLEIAAEKLRCILQRLQCRDLLDLHTLFVDTDIDLIDAKKLFETKAKHKKLDPASLPDRYAERLLQYEKRWEEELREYLSGEPPHFREVERRLTRILKRAKML